MPHGHRLSLGRIAVAAERIDPLFRNSPQFECEPLSDALGCRMVLKVETLNPIRSFKGRGADFWAGEFVAGGGSGPLVAASAGNFGQGLAWACRKYGLALTVFASTGANPLKIERMRRLGATVRLEGEDFDSAKAAARHWATERGWRLVEDGRDAAIAEGAGSIAVELSGTGAHYHAVVVPLGNGALATGMGVWLRSVPRPPQLLAVVSREANAMALSWRAGPGGALCPTAAAGTVADGIAVRIPIPEAVADMHGIVDDVLEVGDDTLLRAVRLVHEHAGLVVEPAGVAGIAAILEHPARFAGTAVATVLCGGNLTPAQIRAWIGG